MKKYIKWGIVIIVGAGLTTLGIHTFTPRENEDLAAVKDVAPTQKNRSLNINAQIIRPHLLTDELFVSRETDALMKKSIFPLKHQERLWTSISRKELL